MISGGSSWKDKPIVHIQYTRSLWIRHDWLGVYLSLLGFKVKAEHAGQVLSADWGESRVLGTRLGCRCRERRWQRRQTRHWYVEVVLRAQTCSDAPSSWPVSNTLERPFALIKHKVQQLKDYASKWLQFQSLWDLKADTCSTIWNWQWNTQGTMKNPLKEPGNDMKLTMKYPRYKNENSTESAREYIWNLQWNPPSYQNEISNEIP